MNKIAISVIVPIYNMEKLMRKCLDSILAQSFHNYECLLIDDGSTDESSNICDEYAEKDSRFKAFHKVNGGLSDARNYGLSKAKGDYTIFFDPDDWADNDYLKDLYDKAIETDADMVMCDYFNEDSYRSQYSEQLPTSLNCDDLLKDLITCKIFGYTWNKLLRRNLYLRFKIQYKKGIYGCEDQYTMCEILKNEIKVSYLPNAYYHYMHYGNESQSRRYDSDTYQMDKIILSLFIKLFNNHPLQELVRVRKISYLVGHAFFGGKQYFSDKDFVTEFKAYENILKEVPRLKVVNLAYWLSFRGYYHFAYNLYNFLFKLNFVLRKI